MRNTNITYADALADKSLLSIDKVRAENDYIAIEASSDEEILELYINGELRCRQKNCGHFVFFESLTEDLPDCTEVKIVCKDKPELCCVISVGLIIA